MSTIGQQEINDVVSSIWTSLLRMQIEPASDAQLTGGQHFAGRVTIRGGWNGAVVVRCASPLAQRIAAAMFELSTSEVSQDDVRDAIGEVTNITAGNLKALMPEGCTLGLPVVSQAAQGDVEPGARTNVEQQARFASAGDSFIVTLVVEH